MNATLCDNFPTCTGTVATNHFRRENGQVRHLCSGCMDDYMHLREPQQVKEIKEQVRLIMALGGTEECKP